MYLNFISYVEIICTQLHTSLFGFKKNIPKGTTTIHFTFLPKKMNYFPVGRVVGY